MIFRCKSCTEKDKHITYLQGLVKDLHDRLMSRDFSHYAFVKKAEAEPAAVIQGNGTDGPVVFDPDTGETF